MLYIFNIDEALQAVLRNDGAACPYSVAVHTEAMGTNFQNTFTFTVPANHSDAQYVTEGYLVAFEDLDLAWQLFEIKRVVDLHGDGLTRTAYCEHALYELYDDMIEDVRPTACSATFALTQALTGTRWEVGTVASLGTNSTNYYYENALSAVKKVANVWGGELQFRVVVTGGVIAHRYVDILTRRGADTGKQFAYGRHTQEIEREADLTTVITAAYGRGKGVETDAGGFGRRLDFGDIVWTTPGDPADKPADREWVGDTAALALWGRAGGTRHRFGTYEDSEETDAATLLQSTWDYLQENNTPRVTYRMTVMDLERLSGYSHEKVRLGDTTRGIDREFSPALLVSVRVIWIDRDLLRPENTKITLGNFAPSLADGALTQRQINKAVSAAFSPTTGTLATAWLDGAINILQNEVNNAAAYVFQTEADGILIMNAATFAAATKAMKLGGGTFALANSKVGAAWDWRTFGDGAGFTADELNAGEVNTSLVKIAGNTYFYWDGDYLYSINPNNLNEQIRLSKEGLRFTKDGGTTWLVALSFDGLRMEGRPTDPRIWYAPDGQRTYNQSGELVAHQGYFELLAAQLATFTRASTAYDSYGTLIASGVPRYEYARQPAPVWSDLFDADQLAAKYTSGGDVAATWAVSGGVLTGTGGTHATLIKNDLLLQNYEVEINSDQAQDGGIIARCQDANNYYLLALSDDSGVSPTSNLQLYKRAGGTLTSLGTADVTWTRGTSKLIKFTLHGSRLEAWFDGVCVISVTDTTFTGGGVGLRNNSVTAFRVLDFKVYYAQRGVMLEEGTTNLFTSAESQGTFVFDSYTKLLLHMNGVDGSTTFTDSATSKAVTAYGHAQVDTAYSKFGGASLLLDGTDDYLGVADSADFDFGTGDFTVDFWGYNLGGNGATIQLADGAWGPAVGYVSGGNLVCYLSSAGASWDIANAVSMGAVPGASWVHYALVRSGNNFYTFRNGTQVSTWTSAASVYMPAGNLNIGRYRGSNGVSLYYASGNLDELRISKGVARWTANFTPPTSEYGVSSTCSLAAGTYALNVNSGTGSITVSGGATGTASYGSPFTFTLGALSNVTFTPSGSVSRCQLENKSYATLWQIGGTARNAEVMTVPSSVFTRGNWTINIKYQPLQGVIATNYRILFQLLIDANNYYQLSILPDTGYIDFRVKSNGTVKAITTNYAVVARNTYLIMVSGDGMDIRLYVNGVQIGSDLAYTETVGALPATIKMTDSSGFSQPNGTMGNFAVMNRARTLAEHVADYNTGLPLTVDEYTTLLMTMDGTLQPTVRGFGLWSKNGRFILQDPVAGQGLEVWDGTTRKVLIGRLDDDSIGQEIVGGKLYSSLFRTGTVTDTSYVSLEPPTWFKCVYNGNNVVTIQAGGSTGQISVYEAGAEKARLVATYSVNSLNYSVIQPGYLSTTGIGLIGPDSNSILLKANNGIDYHAGSSDHNFYGGDINLTGGTKNNIEETINYGKRKLAVRESPEQKYIDEKKEQLINGICKVTIEPIYLECIEPNTDDTPWLIHLTPYADMGVYVAEIGLGYFVVKERDSGMSNSVFVWSLSATRKNYVFYRLPEVIENV